MWVSGCVWAGGCGRAAGEAVEGRRIIKLTPPTSKMLGKVVAHE